MDILKDKTNEDLIKSILAETAKSKNEIASAEADIQKVKNRLSFMIVLVNELINRHKGDQ